MGRGGAAPAKDEPPLTRGSLVLALPPPSCSCAFFPFFSPGLNPEVFVEALDKCFENVCELDLIFHSDKVGRGVAKA